MLLDGQGLVRKPQVGPLELDADFDRDILEHVSILKLSEEEAELVGEVDVPGAPSSPSARGGSIVHANGRATRVPAWPLTRDPTGAGDGFSAAYLAARAAGHAPVRRRAPGDRGRGGDAAMKAVVQTEYGAFEVDLDTEEVEPAGPSTFPRRSRWIFPCRGSSRPRPPARRSSPSSTASRRSSSRTTPASRGARPAAGSRLEPP